MTKPRLSTWCVLTVVLTLAAIPLSASDPCGVYALIQKVVLEPNDAEPTAVQVWGAFSWAVPRSNDGTQSKPAGSFGAASTGDVYAAVQKGYLYYACAKSRDAACLREWADLKSVAGKNEVVGFGMRWSPAARVRAADEKPASPDVYVMNAGVVKMGKYSSAPDLVAALEAALRTK